jgi:hypothetical protein
LGCTDLDDLHPTVGQQLGGAAGGEDFNVQRGEVARQIDDAGLVGDAEKGTANGEIA